MNKFKIKYVKNVFCPKHNCGTDWETPPTLDFELGVNHTEKLNKYQYSSNNISLLCSDFLNNDDRKYKKSAKFTENEANILLLKYIEKKLRELKRNEKENNSVKFTTMNDYFLKVNSRELIFYQRQAKIYRKKVRELKKTPEYMWEQLVK